MTFGTFLLFHCLYFLIFLKSCFNFDLHIECFFFFFFLNLLLCCCLSTFQNRRLKLKWSSLPGGMLPPRLCYWRVEVLVGFFMGDLSNVPAHLLWTICLFIENSCFLREYYSASCLGICIWLLALEVWDWKRVVGSREGWRLACSVDTHHSTVPFLSLVAQPHLPVFLECLFLLGVGSGGPLLWPERLCPHQTHGLKPGSHGDGIWGGGLLGGDYVIWDHVGTPIMGLALLMRKDSFWCVRTA